MLKDPCRTTLVDLCTRALGKDNGKLSARHPLHGNICVTPKHACSLISISDFLYTFVLCQKSVIWYLNTTCSM